MSEQIHIISLGAGVQSSTMALMAAAGEIKPMPKAAVFADVGGWEPKGVYEYLEWLTGVLPFPVYRVQRDGGLVESALRIKTSGVTGKTYLETGLPVFYKDAHGNIGIGRRQCTEEFKLYPLYSKFKELSGTEKAIVWVGISTDEAARIKPSRRAFVVNRWPLIELNMSRNMCLEWLDGNGHPTPPRSACVFCPYHHGNEWRRLKSEHPLDFQRAVDFENRLQYAASKATALRGTPFLHRSGEPLSEVDFSTEEERGQLNMFNNECEGMCGV